MLVCLQWNVACSHAWSRPFIFSVCRRWNITFRSRCGRISETSLDSERCRTRWLAATGKDIRTFNFRTTCGSPRQTYIYSMKWLSRVCGNTSLHSRNVNDNSSVEKTVFKQSNSTCRRSKFTQVREFWKFTITLETENWQIWNYVLQCGKWHNKYFNRTFLFAWSQMRQILVFASRAVCSYNEPPWSTGYNFSSYIK